MLTIEPACTIYVVGDQKALKKEPAIIGSKYWLSHRCISTGKQLSDTVSLVVAFCNCIYGDLGAA